MVGWVLRILVAAGLLGSAWVHLVVWLDWASETAVVGELFLVNVVAGVIIAAAVLLWRHWLPALTAVGFGAATLLAYALSLTVGLFGVQEQFATQEELWALLAEAGCVVFGLALLFVSGRQASVRGEVA